MRLKETDPTGAAEAFDAGMTMLRQGHVEARRLISGVRPPVLDESGVVPAIAHLVHEVSRQKGPQIEYHTKVEFDRLPPILENAIYRVSQEALTNACKHSKSPKVRVGLRQQGDQLRLEIRDWGIGFDPGKVKEGCYGLEGIGSGCDCWGASAASAVRRAKAPALPSSCRWPARSKAAQIDRMVKAPRPDRATSPTGWRSPRGRGGSGR